MFLRLRAVLLGLMAAAVVVFAAAPAAVAQENWVLLKSEPVPAGGERHAIDVRQAPGAFRAIRLVAKGRGIEINNVDVAYESGPTHSEKREINLLAGERTRAINPGNTDRLIDSVTLSYKRQPGGANPVIEVYGLQTPSGARVARATPPAPRTGSQVQGPSTTPERAPPTTNAQA
ncbi:MAG: hypothetical protein RL291_1396, partial [Pseudomonadota bacterium]